MLEKDLYEILGVTKNATDTEIRKAFLKLAKKHHPDVNPNNKEAEQKFKEVNFAHEVLKDKAKRAQYDQMRETVASGRHHGAPQAGRTWAGQGAEPFGYEAFSDFGLGDLFQEIFGGSAGFGGGFGGRAGTRPGARRTSGVPFAQRGADQSAELAISFQDAARGAERALDFSDGRKITVKIPAGVETGSKIKLTGQGEKGQGGAPNGDLLITLEVAAHRLFVREGLDLVLKFPITFAEAVLGAEVDVPTLDGKVVMKIPKGISSGQRLKLGGKGIRSVRSNQQGDQLVEVSIKVPKNLDAVYQEAAEKLKTSTFNPREDW